MLYSSFCHNSTWNRNKSERCEHYLPIWSTQEHLVTLSRRVTEEDGVGMQHNHLCSWSFRLSSKEVANKLKRWRGSMLQNGNRPTRTARLCFECTPPWRKGHSPLMPVNLLRTGALHIRKNPWDRENVGWSWTVTSAISRVNIGECLPNGGTKGSTTPAAYHRPTVCTIKWLQLRKQSTLYRTLF